MNWHYVIDNLPKFIEASLLTLRLAFWGISFSLIIGLICAILTSHRLKGLSLLANAYIELSRNTPLLIQLFFLYFGLSKIGIKVDGFHCAVIGLSFLGGSYMAEAFRAGIQSVSKGQIESASALDLTRCKPLFMSFFRKPSALPFLPSRRIVYFYSKKPLSPVRSRWQN